MKHMFLVVKEGMNNSFWQVSVMVCLFMGQRYCISSEHLLNFLLHSTEHGREQRLLARGCSPLCFALCCYFPVLVSLSAGLLALPYFWSLPSCSWKRPFLSPPVCRSPGSGTAGPGRGRRCRLHSGGQNQSCSCFMVSERLKEEEVQEKQPPVEFT